MNSWRRALRFIATQQRGAKNARGINRKAVTIALGKERINADVYATGNAEAPTIFFLHGMSPLGISDPRQIVAAKALAAAGFRVICPELPEIRNLKVEAGSIDRFQKILRHLKDNRELCPTGRFALFAPSFSGAICLKVAADREVADSITTIAALGAFSRIERSLNHLMHDEAADPYARLVILANFLPRLKEGKRLGRYYLAAAHDNWQDTASRNPSLTGFEPTDEKSKELRRLNATERKLIARIAEDTVFRIELGGRLLKVMQDTLDAYNVSEVAGAIRAPVFLLHGAKDDVIPARESAELFPLLQEARLVVTPLMGHSHAAVSLRLIGDVWRLVAGFAWFFRKAAE
ncbi:MAG TPA: alpha/beta hydrolase [Turneriella sp.]|nr:alpha/beta hydrolase [Turneriella sp.]HNJ66010.1 alpha/beta hydrolase [Turneriella sp.]